MRKLFRPGKKHDLVDPSLPGPIEAAFPSGIKQFYESPGASDVDVVFIHGLDGNREKTWTAKGADEPWPKTLLPLELPSARILTFGYDAYAAKWEKGGSQNRIRDHAWNLLTALASCRESDDTKKRPIIFVCHSLGGLVCKDALIVAQMQSDSHIHDIYERTHAIAFMGTPHHGSELAIWADRLLKSVNIVQKRNTDIIGVLNANSEVLQRIQEGFFATIWGKEEGVSRQIQITCFHEELPTSIKGFSKIVVSKESASLPGSIRIGIHRDHTQMTKFSDREDPGFKATCGELRRWAMSTKPPYMNEQRGEFKIPVRQKEGMKTSNQAKFVVPYLKNEKFVGRTEILDQLKARLSFSEESHASQRRVSLFGLGGVGKTQIALAFIHWIKEANLEVSVIWVHASNPERFQQSFSSIAEEFQIPGHEDPKSNVLVLVRQWLEKKDCGKWLMVLDNADDAELFFGKSSPAESHPLDASTNLAQYLPECTHGALLITTRNKQIGVKIASGDGSSMLQVKEMDASESESLLKSSLVTLAANEEEVRALSSRLEQLPLALAQAASFILEYSMSVTEYLELLSEGDSAFIDLLSQEFEAVARDRERSRAVANTWMISFQQIKKQNPLASELLSMMSFLDRQDITIETLQEYNRQHEDGPRSNIELKRSIGILKNFSLVTEQKNGSLDMHRLVQLVTRSWLDKTEASDRFRRKALVCISNLYPFGKFENREVCRAYLAHALAVLELHAANKDEEATSRASLLHCVGGYFWQEGQHRHAEKMVREAFEVHMSSLGETHPATLQSMGNFAATLYSQGRYEEAEKLGIQSLEAWKISLGETHPDTLYSMGNLAATFYCQGRYEEAEKLQNQALEGRKKSLGETHPHTLTSMANLAATFYCQGRYEEAEKLGIQSLEAWKISLGETHPHTLTSMANLAATFYSQGRYEEAEKLEIRVLEARKISLGETHPDILCSIASLAATFHSQGRYKEAEKLENQALKGRKKSLGETHPHTLTSMANLGYTLHALGHLDAALGLMTTCLDSRKRVLGKDHPDTLSCVKTLKEWGNGTEN
ncbi:unnamed protein product [Clonostachys rhizophaga]|uniref:Nephrocystin-3 n=1 Tax=Clonostachys rhizophaga TaxID=160324 RepID=A0A9N9V9A4_9HYPO|nr:unnamed protein product [Clonostachys rhizophaga]